MAPLVPVVSVVASNMGAMAPAMSVCARSLNSLVRAKFNPNRNGRRGFHSIKVSKSIVDAKREYE